MLIRLTCFGVSLLACAATLSPEEKIVDLRVGDHLVVNMTGEVAKEYATRCGMSKTKIVDAEGLSIETSGAVEQRLADGSYRIEHYATIQNDTSKPRMVTLTAVVKPTQIRNEIIPANTAVYTSPDDAKKGVKPVVTKREETLLRIELSTLQEAKLRTWEMLDEVGK